ncbi:uncharacterized protein LOC124545568 [Schistocerca americana]|uniref:uncharacterized protein LOC124545568 n=1 Tax=Schistocerca americana TaxID=7009 RepID=UPI001F4FB2C6|nr:uncharacterized protein LOC124545568 [Schistocerca americana]
MGKNKRGRRGKKSNRRKVVATGAPIESADKVCSCAEHYHSDEYYDSDELDYKRRKKPADPLPALADPADQANSNGEQHGCTTQQAKCSEEAQDENTLQAGPTCDRDAKKTRRRRRRGKCADALPPQEEAAPQSVEQPLEETAGVVSEKKKRRRRRKYATASPHASEDGASGSGGGSRPEQAPAVAGGFSSLKQLEEQVIADLRRLFTDHRLSATVLESLLKATK